MKIKTINTLPFYILPVLLPLTGHAATITCDTTLYFCSSAEGDDVVVTTDKTAGLAPLQGYGVYLNNSRYNLKNITITTTGGQADGIFSNGNNGSRFISAGTVNIKTTGNSADGINLGTLGGPRGSLSPSVNIVTFLGKNGVIEAEGMGVRANNNLGKGSQSVIVLGDGYTIRQTGKETDNSTEGTGYAVYAGNRDEDVGGFGFWDMVFGKRNNNKGDSYVIIGSDATISSSSISSRNYRSAAVYANKGGLIQLGNNVAVSAPSGEYYLFASAEKQNPGTNNANDTAEVRPGTILLNGDVTFRDVADTASVVMHSKGEKSLIKSGYLTYEIDKDGLNIQKNIQESGGKFTLDGTLLASEGGTIALNMRDGSYFNGMTRIDNDQSVIDLSVNGAASRWQLAGDSSLTQLSLTDGAVLLAHHEKDNAVTPLTLTGNVNNYSGIIDLTGNKDLTATDKVTTFTVSGNYLGGAAKPDTNNAYPGGNGVLRVNTLWNSDDSSYTDKLNINGTADGFTRVDIKNGIIGNVAQGSADKFSVPVVTVSDHTAGSNAFYGFADTAGAGQALLVQKDDNNYVWRLPKKDPGKPDPGKPDPGTPDPEKPDPEQPDPVKPEVPAFNLMPRANMELGYNLVRSLHERSGEQQTARWGASAQGDNQVWGKLIGNLESTDGKNRYGYQSKLWGAQFGYDFLITEDAETKARRHSGVMVTYLKDNLNFYDRKSVRFNKAAKEYESYEARSGKGQTDTVAVGAYTTAYSAEGAYTDLVANLDYSRNKYTSGRESESSNHSWGMVLSAEAGKPFTLTQDEQTGSSWIIEPQAQLIWQYRTFSSFTTDHNIKVDQDNRHGLRGRAGVRLARHSDQPGTAPGTLYFTANVIQDFVNADKGTRVGNSYVKEKTPGTTGELGAGLQLPLGGDAFMYTDVRYSHSLGSSRGDSEGVSGNIGIRWQF